MNRDIAKRSQNIALGVKHPDSGGASPQRPRPAVRSTGGLAGPECKGCPAPHRDSKTPRPTRTGRLRAVLVLGLSRLLEIVVALNRRRRDRQLLAEMNERSLRDIGIGSTTADGQVCAATGTAGSGPGFFLPAPPWNELIQSGERYAPIPDNPFAPAH